MMWSGIVLDGSTIFRLRTGPGKTLIRQKRHYGIVLAKEGFSERSRCIVLR